MVVSISLLIIVGYAIAPQVMDALASIPVHIWEGLQEAIKAVVSRILKMI